MYAIATAMDPRLKFQYWIDEGWDKLDDDGNNWYEVSKNKVQHKWVVGYKDTTTPMIDRSTTPMTITGDAPFGTSIFEQKIQKKRRVDTDELDMYVREACCAEEDELAYWSRMQKTFPHLAEMARAFLGIPATSTPCERLFSKAKYFIPASRNRLTTETAKQSILLSSWIDFKRTE